VTSLNPVERDIAQIFQFPVIYDTMTVYNNLAFPLKNRGLSKAEIDIKSEGNCRNVGTYINFK
jgi:glycerol transport system ATP-binding protein